MEKKDLRIVYMGTPDFAVESLKCLVEGGYNVVGVITMPDKPMGRHGSVLQPSPVKQYAVSQGLRVLQPERLKDESFVEELRSLQADLQIVVAFRMLPEVVWNMPRLGTFNLHASLLPQYRGAAPINWAVINGDTETGITTFFLKHEINWSSSPRISDNTAYFSSPAFLINPIAIPETGFFIGTPASINAKVPAHTVAIEDEPFDSRISETTRTEYG